MTRLKRLTFVCYRGLGCRRCALANCPFQNKAFARACVINDLTEALSMIKGCNPSHRPSPPSIQPFSPRRNREQCKLEPFAEEIAQLAICYSDLPQSYRTSDSSADLRRLRNPTSLEIREGIKHQDGGGCIACFYTLPISAKRPNGRKGKREQTQRRRGRQADRESRRRRTAKEWAILLSCPAKRRAGCSLPSRPLASF